MSSCRLLICTASDHPCRETGCNRLHEILSRFFPQAEIRNSEALTDRSVVDLSVVPALVVLRAVDPSATKLQARKYRERFPDVPILAVLCDLTARDGVLGEMIQDLDDYVCCPFREEELRLRATRLLGRATGHEHSGWQDFRKDGRFQGLLGDSPLFRQALEKVQKIAACDCTCLIEGATGTGKEMFARAIHYLSPRKSRPFVPVNCGALPENLIENELFGHVKGAYTDAREGGGGLLSFAEDGTLFLDEIDTLSLSAQAKLLRVLQEHEYRPVGSPRTFATKARILAATNSDLRSRVTKREFREDLFYRLNILRLALPKLSERSDDIPLLANHFLKIYAESRQKNLREISTSALEKLMAYHWPGNVRELESVIQRALLMSSGTRLEESDIDLQEPSPVGLPHEAAARDHSGAKLRAIERFERSYLTKLMSAHQGNVSRAARAAGQERRSLQRLLRKYQISSAAYRSGVRRSDQVNQGS